METIAADPQVEGGLITIEILVGWLPYSELRLIEMDKIQKDFPIIERYRNAAGKIIDFSINAEQLAIGYSVTAIETDKSKGKRIGYNFHIFSGTINEALWKIRSKIKENLATKYVDEEEGHKVLTHDKLVGRITSSDIGNTVIEVDGKEIDPENFWGILSMYDGFEILLKIKEQ